MDASESISSLVEEVYACRKCENRGFSRRFATTAPGNFSKFPPLIGKSGKVDILFIGLNPRRTSNLTIHEFAMRDIDSFVALSKNLNSDGSAYIGPLRGKRGREPHYDRHCRIAYEAFGTPFDHVAAVTEMFLCATANSKGLKCEESPCAQAYLMRTLSIAQPDFIVTLGTGAWRYFRDRVRRIGSLGVFHLPFPRSWHLSASTMQAAEDWTIAGIQALKNRREPPPAEWSHRDLPAVVMTYNDEPRSIKPASGG